MNAPQGRPAPGQGEDEKVAGRKRWRWFAAWLAGVVAIILCADVGWLRPIYEWIGQHPGSDKVGHFVLIGGMTLMLNLALKMRLVAIGPFHVAMGGLIIAVAMTCEETSQIWIPTRTFDLFDLAANYAGVLCAGWLARWWLRRKGR